MSSSINEAAALLPDGGYVKPAELAGYQIRFLSDEPAAEMATTAEVG